MRYGRFEFGALTWIGRFRREEEAVNIGSRAVTVMDVSYLTYAGAYNKYGFVKLVNLNKSKLILRDICCKAIDLM